jgi:hypothetical protein
VYSTRAVKTQSYTPILGTASSAPTSHPNFGDKGEKSLQPLKSHLKVTPETERTEPAAPQEYPRYEEKKKLSPLEIVSKIINKVNKLLQFRIERAEQAKEMLHLLKKLKNLLSLDDDVYKSLINHPFIIPLMSSTEYICRFEYLVEATLEVIVPLIRNGTVQVEVLDILLSNGGLIFCMSSLRLFNHNGSIRVLAVEILAKYIDYIQVLTLPPPSDKVAAISPTLQIPFNRKSLQEKRYANRAYFTHQLLLHGASTILPTLLSQFLESSLDMGVRRVLKCEKGEREKLMNKIQFS